MLPRVSAGESVAVGAAVDVRVGGMTVGEAIVGVAAASKGSGVAVGSAGVAVGVAVVPGKTGMTSTIPIFNLDD